MNGSLIDTNIIIKVLREDADTIRFLNTPSDIFVPTIVIGEFLYGINKSSRKEENRKQFLNFMKDFAILGVGYATANSYALIKYNLYSMLSQTVLCDRALSE
jgi:predicted nucleic acid-binding protein